LIREVVELLRSFCRERFTIISDGDIDGILGASLVSMKLYELGCYDNVESISYPTPGSLVNMIIPRSVLIELPPSRGYIVRAEALIFDHHEFTGVKLVGRGGEVYASYLIETIYPSVSSMILEILGVEVPKELDPILRAADLIDSGKSREDAWAWTLHRAYLFHIEDQQMRKDLYRWIMNKEIDRIFKWAEEGSRRYEKSREKIPEIIGRAQLINSLAVSWIDPRTKEEKIAMREAMLELEKRHEIVLILEIEDNTVKRAHIGSISSIVKPIIDRILEELKRRNVVASGGGRANVGGIQIPEGIKLEEMIEILKKIHRTNRI
jgi:hypothetical protein